VQCFLTEGLSEHCSISAPSRFVLLAELHEQGMGLEEKGWRSFGIAHVTRPLVLRRVIDDSGADRVELDVPIAIEKVLAVLDDARFEATFVERTRSFVESIDELSMPLLQSLHELGGRNGGAGSEKEMDVIGHQREGVNIASAVAQQLFHAREITAVVVLRQEDACAIVAAMPDVHRRSCQTESRGPGHAH